MEDFKAAPGAVFVIPDLSQNTVAGIESAIQETDLPIGTVVSVGRIPWEYSGLNIQPGSRVIYTRSVSPEIEATIDGRQRKLKALLITDIRAIYYDSPEEKRRLISGVKFKLIIALFALTFAAGSAFGGRLVGLVKIWWKSAHSRKDGSNGAR